MLLEPLVRPAFHPSSSAVGDPWERSLSGLRHRTGLGRLVSVKPLVHPTTDLLFLLSISFLQRARKLVVIAFDLHQIVIGELAPLFFEFSLELFPLSLELFAIHGRPPS